jgi:ankyrin repeat protein
VHLVQALLSRGASPNASSRDRTTPLEAAIVAPLLAGTYPGASSQPRHATIQALLRAGASAISADATGCTAVYSAAVMDDAATIDELAARGADVDRPCQGNMPLHAAVIHGAVHAAAALLRHGTRLGVRNAKGQTALMLAKQIGQPNMVRLLNQATEATQ